MSSSGSLRETLLRVGTLAALPADELAPAVAKIVEHTERLMTVDTEGVEPTYTYPPPAALDLDASNRFEGEDIEPAELRAGFVEREEDRLIVPAPAAGQPSS